jgi:ABC-type transporter Mla MlaB component
MAANQSTTITFPIRGPIARADLPGLCARVCALLEGSGVEVAVCEVFDVEVDAVTVDALAQLQLAARRRGCQVRLRGTTPQLRELLAFMGLADVLPEASPRAAPAG